MKIVMIVLTFLVAASVMPALAHAQQQSERAQAALKEARLMEADAAISMRSVLPPSSQTDRRDYFGYRLMIGALYEPSIFPDKTWLYIACNAVDPRVAYEESKFGFSLVRVHALIYEVDRNGNLNERTMLNTVDTPESDEGICDLEGGWDTSFIEIPRTFDAAAVTLFSAGRRTQYIEVVEKVDRILIPAP